ncbi:MAG: hypothetical protein ABIR62_11135 [Dokdonella sp.]|uniref:hypothetical protein n=1 Tax=Dokdonella sp. TaxID=2291710 RepID=UPI003264CED7
MANGLLKALKKVGLVQIAEDEATPETQVAEPVVEAMPEPPPATLTSEVAEQVPFDQIYAQGEVPACPYPAEKLLKVLNGLRAMDATTRKAAVSAMDEADDTWAIEDVLLDADRKMKALEARKRLLVAQARAADADATQRVRERDKQQQEAVVSVRQQIADLQALMEREVAKATADKSAAQAKSQSAQQACARESARIDAEIARLQEIPATFGASAMRAQ